MGWLSSLLWLGVVLGYSFVLGVRPPNLLNARVCRGMAFGGVDEEASQLLGTRTHVVTMGGLRVEFSSGLSSVNLASWEYGHQTFSMHGYVEDGFLRSS